MSNALPAPGQDAAKRAAEIGQRFAMKFYLIANQAQREWIDAEFATALAQARAEERAWWLKMSDAWFPCIEAGRPRGSCKHESFIECLLDADALRTPGGSPGRAA